MGRRTCGAVQSKTRKEKYAKQYEVTERNRRIKRLRHLKKHPNHIKGMEGIRKALGFD